MSEIHYFAALVAALLAGMYAILRSWRYEREADEEIKRQNAEKVKQFPLRRIK